MEGVADLAAIKTSLGKMINELQDITDILDSNGNSHRVPRATEEDILMDAVDIILKALGRGITRFFIKAREPCREHADRSTDCSEDRVADRVAITDSEGDEEDSLIWEAPIYSPTKARFEDLRFVIKQ